MAIYRINVYNTYEYILERKAFSVPSIHHKKYNELSDVSNWQELENIKTGNLILICRGIRDIWAIAYANDDCRLSDIDAFKDPIHYEENGYQYVSFHLCLELNKPIHGDTYFRGLLKNDPFHEKFFCVHLEPDENKKEEYIESVNRLLNVTD